MVAQVVLAAESLGARGANERSFVGVSADVNLEVVRLGELTLAETTDVLGRACPPTTHATAAYTRSSNHAMCTDPRIFAPSDIRSRT